MFLRAGLVSLALLLASRLLGLLRESVQAAALGAGAAADVAILMLTLPDLLTGILASGGLGGIRCRGFGGGLAFGSLLLGAVASARQPLGHPCGRIRGEPAGASGEHQHEGETVLAGELAAGTGALCAETVGVDEDLIGLGAAALAFAPESAFKGTQRDPFRRLHQTLRGLGRRVVGREGEDLLRGEGRHGLGNRIQIRELAANGFFGGRTGC